MSERSGTSRSQRGRLSFTVGLPCSGKSSVASAWARCYEGLEPPPPSWSSRRGGFTVTSDWGPGPRYGRQTLELHCNPRVVVAGDDFRHALHGHEYLPESEGVVFAHMDVAARALLGRGFDVMMDETCTTQSTLLRYLRLDLDAQPVFVETPAGVCKERALALGRDYLVGPIDRMARQLRELRSDWDNTVARLKEYVLLRKGLDVAI